LSWILDEEVLAVLIAIVLVSSVIAGVQILNAGRVIEPFSELGLLGPSGKISDYPKEVIAGSKFTLNIYIGNHEGKTMYYKILIKFSNNSAINETIPLSSKPIMEVRTILCHNDSQIIPVNITLYEPGRLRLVFEMWIFNESIGDFSYNGIWNQLWLNVTKPSIEYQVPIIYKEISPQLESKLIDGYLSIRRAENNGGNVSEMVTMMNQALYYAQIGDNAKAEEIINKVISIEPEISRIGMENSKIRLYTSVGTIATIITIGILFFIYFRHRIWIYWAKINGNYKVIWIGGNNKLNNIEKIIKDKIKSNNELYVSDIVFKLKVNNKSYEIAKTLYKLNKNKILKIIDPNPPKKFINYLFSRYNIGFMIAIILIALCLISVYLSEFIIVSALRIVFGSIFVLFIPGYSLVEALYPREEDISPLERLALSIGLSLALVPLIGLILNYTPWGIRLNPILISLSLTSLTLLIISSYRKFNIFRLRYE
jgi:uncharacterized membrane protein